MLHRARARGTLASMVFANIFGGDTLIVVVIAIVVIFGGSQLPKIARNVGSAGREFRKAQAEAEAEEAAKAAKASKAAEQQPPAVTAGTGTPAAAKTNSPQENVTLTREELESLLDERIKRQQSAG